MTYWTDIPDGYYAIPDPNDPTLITYWRRKNNTLKAWPAKAWYGPPVPRRSELPDAGPAREAFVQKWWASRRAYLDRIATAVLADPATAGKRFANFGIRCCQCGRTLRDATSTTYGIGPECRSGMDPALLARYLTPAVGRAHAKHLANQNT